MPRTLTFRRAADLNRMLRSLSREASRGIRAESRAIAGDVAAAAESRALALGGAAKVVAPSLRAVSDRVPAVRLGGSARLREGERQTVGDVIWGAEFGGGRRRTTRQFAPWRGNGEGAGYFLFPTVRDMEDEVLERYGDAVMRAVDASARGAA